jgi:hypothetical protein
MRELLHSPYNDEGVEVKPRWKQYLEILKLYITLHFRPTDYFLLRFYKKDCTEKDMVKYISYSWFYHKINEKMTYKSWISLFKNKAEFNIYAKTKDLKVPIDFGIYNTTYGHDYKSNKSLKNANELEALLAESGHTAFIFKDLSGTGGKNVFLVELASGSNEEKRLKVDGSPFTYEELDTKLGDGEFLIQERLVNDPVINAINPHAISTFRILTYLTTLGEVKIIGSYMRAGVQRVCVDNWSKGGVIVAYDVDSGRFGEVGFNQHYKVFTEHPATGVVFKDVYLPFWKELREFASNCARAFPMMPFVGWDIACTTKGFYIIEANVQHINPLYSQFLGSGMAELIRGDLEKRGVHYPDKKLPPITLPMIIERISLTIKGQ